MKNSAFLLGLSLLVAACSGDDERKLVEVPDSGKPLAAGICGDPLEPKGLDGEGVRFDGSVDNHASVLGGSCGGAGREVVHRFVAPARGTMVVGLEAERGFVIYARRSCADEGAELFCGGPQDGTRSIAMEAGEVLFVMVDAPEVVAEPTYHLDVTFVPTLGEGDACDLEGAKGRCDSGLYCEWSALVCAPNRAPTLDQADAVFRNGGGGDARVRVHGTDPDGNLVGLAIRFLDAGGGRVQVNGLGELYTPFDDTARQATEFSWTRVLRTLATSYPNAVAVEVELVDGAGARSQTTVLEIGKPVQNGTGEGCDPEGWEAICGTSDLCQKWRGDEPFCEAQQPPVATSAKAWRTEGGALVVVVDGEDPNGDMTSWFGSLLDGEDKPVTAYSRRATEGTTGFDRSFGGEEAFHAISTWGGVLGRYPSVTKVRLQLVDSGGNRSDPLEISLESPTQVGADESCDPDVIATTCGDELACAKDPEDAFLCTDRSAARLQKCDAAPVIRVGETVSGALWGDNLWTPFAECSPVSASMERHEGPDAIVRLEVEELTETLRLTTDLPGTKTGHTALYVLSSCESEEFFACNDEYMNGIAHTTLTMKNVLPGTYFVVVDTASGAGPFELKASND